MPPGDQGAGPVAAEQDARDGTRREQRDDERCDGDRGRQRPPTLDDPEEDRCLERGCDLCERDDHAREQRDRHRPDVDGEGRVHSVAHPSLPDQEPDEHRDAEHQQPDPQRRELAAVEAHDRCRQAQQPERPHPVAHDELRPRLGGRPGTGCSDAPCRTRGWRGSATTAKRWPASRGWASRRSGARARWRSTGRAWRTQHPARWRASHRCTPWRPSRWRSG